MYPKDISAGELLRFQPSYLTDCDLCCFPVFSHSGILSMIIIRTLRKDIANYNREDDIVRKSRPTLFQTALEERSLIVSVTERIDELSVYSRHLTICLLCLTRRTPWRSRDGRTSTVTCSGRLSIPWSSARCWAQGSSSSAWSSLSSVSLRSLSSLVYTRSAATRSYLTWV